MRDRRAPQHRHATRAHQLDHLEVRQQGDERFYLLLVAGDLHDHGVRPHVHHLGVEDVHQLDDLAPVARIRAHLHHRHLAADHAFRRNVADVHNLYQLIDLLDDLLGIRAGVDDEGHAGEPRRLRMADGEALDVEATLAPLGGDPVEDAGPVLHQGDDRMLLDAVSLVHVLTPTRSSSKTGRSIVSSRAAPAGTMGKQFSSSLTWKSQTTGPACAIACWMTGSTSSLRAALRPRMPNASASFTKSGLAMGVATMLLR